MTPSPTGPVPGLVLAAPHSGAGKTSLTIGLLQALKDRGVAVASAKCGPDYIDPMLHGAVLGRASINLDPWAMTAGAIRTAAMQQADGHSLLLIEGVMGLFDGATGGGGSTADLASLLRLPVVLVVDVSHQAQSVAALVQGFARFRPDVTVAGVILNRAGSDRHTAILRAALDPVGIPVLGAVPRTAGLALPSRHLGLVPAAEIEALDTVLERLGHLMVQSVDLDRLLALARPVAGGDGADRRGDLPPPGQRVAVARDAAFCFAYPHLLQGWQRAGAEILPFSPLAGEAPSVAADFIFLPGGYPELHAGALSSARSFLTGLRDAAGRGVPVYGECGGYMVLGAGLVDAGGQRHAMADLLPVETSFAERRLHLGYRRLTQVADSLPWPRHLTAHEFHYASVLREGDGPALFHATDATGADRPAMGRRNGAVMGSFAHVIAGDAEAVDPASRTVVPSD